MIGRHITVQGIAQCRPVSAEENLRLPRSPHSFWHAASALAGLLLGGLGGSAAATDDPGFVLCLLGDECRLTTLERCLGKGGHPSPSWEDCLPNVPVAAEWLPDLRQGGGFVSGASEVQECAFPYELTIRGRNRLVYLTHAYEVTFESGATIQVDFGTRGFVVADSLVHAPHPGPRVAWAHLELLGDHFGMGSGLAGRAGDFSVAPTPTVEAFPSEEEACIWLRMIQLLERTGTPLEVRLDRGETSLMMSPLDE